MKLLFGILKYIFVSLVVVSVIGSIFGAAFFVYFSSGLPNIITTEDYQPWTVTKVLGKGDAVVGEFFEQRRYIVPYEDIPEFVIQGFVAAEDDRFFEHHGIDLQGILRAAVANFKAGRVVQGGSTITQQVAKSLLLTPERSFVRKIKEAILANRMEKNLSKKQILYLYLNQIYLGQGAYGISAAAQVYFGKTVKDLTLAEAAVLAGLPQAPSAYSPFSNPKKAKERQLYVLRRLQEGGMISSVQVSEAAEEPIKVYFPKDRNLDIAPYYVEHVRKYLFEKYGKEMLYEKGLIVKTPIDPELSIKAQKFLQEGLRNADKRQGYRGPLQKNKNSELILKAISEVAESNFNKKYSFKVLRADGTFETNFEKRIPINTTLYSAFNIGDIYKAVVTLVNDSKKEVSVDLGLVKGIISLDNMKWAKPFREQPSGIEFISRPSQALSKGDVILVRVLALPEKALTAAEPLQLALEQEPLVQGALLSMDTINGEVLAMAGGYDFSTSEFNRAIQAERQPGSAYKPVIYAAAIDKGYNPATIIQDSPIVFDAGENLKWKPENYEEKFYGDTLFRSALIHSRNVPTIKIVQDIEVPYLIEYSKRLGITGNLNPDLSISLGSCTLSLLGVVKVFSIFPRGGRKIKPIFINKVLDRNGSILEENLPTPPVNIANYVPNFTPTPVRVAGELQTRSKKQHSEQQDGQTSQPVTANHWMDDPQDPDQVMDPRTAYLMTHLMNEVATMGTGHEAKNLGRPAAGKTGTTNDFQDAWFVGFIPQVTTGVWVGYDAQKSMGPRSSGALISLPIWLEFMKEAVTRYPIEQFQVPPGVNFTYIDSRTGKRSTLNKPYSVKEVFASGTEPQEEGVIPTARGNQGVDGAPYGNSTSQDFFKEDIQ